MNETASKCDHGRLRLLLTDELADVDQAKMANHLAGCADCRARLEALAGEPNWWQEVETCFRAHSGEAASMSGEATSSIDDHDASELSFAADFAVGFLEPCDQSESIGRLGEYEIQEVIGRGGMGIVLKGYQRELGRYVAVKVMAPHLATSAAARRRFVREARAAAAIVHPNVMPIHSVCTTSPLPYLVMPFVACESLQQRIDREGPLGLKEILRIGLQVSAALAAAHAQGLVHRDVKPANILLERGVDRVMLTDFGLARAVDDGSLTRTGIVAGTPQYMSPEQAIGDATDARSDLFSLGSVIYAMATGEAPFRAETALGVLRRICDTRPRPIHATNSKLPTWLERLVDRLHEKAPEERCASASEAADLLEKCLAHVQQPTVAKLPDSLGSEGPPTRLGHVRRSALWLMVVALAGAIIVALKFGPTLWQSSPGGTAPIEPTSIIGLMDETVSLEAESIRDQIKPLEERVWDFWEPIGPAENDSK